MNQLPAPVVKLAPHVLREMKIKQAKEYLGARYLCHPSQHVKRKTKS